MPPHTSLQRGVTAIENPNRKIGAFYPPFKSA
jgi:hypothetical protein